MPMSMEQPKKQVGGAYGIFLSEKRPEYTKACAGQRASEISKMAGGAWKKLSDKQKAPYQTKYEEAKAQFDKGMAAFLEAGGEKTKGARALASEKRKAKSGKKVKDANAPKKPAGGGYGVFLAENRATITKSLPAGHKITDVAKVAGARWKALSDAMKKPFQNKFAKKQEEYAAAFAEYKKTLPADAEDEEDEDDEEEEEEEEREEEASEPPSKKVRKAGA